MFALRSHILQLLENNQLLALLVKLDTEIRASSVLLKTGYVNGKLVVITRMHRIAAVSLATGRAEENFCFRKSKWAIPSVWMM